MHRKYDIKIKGFYENNPEKKEIIMKKFKPKGEKHTSKQEQNKKI